MKRGMSKPSQARKNQSRWVVRARYGLAFLKIIIKLDRQAGYLQAAACRISFVLNRMVFATPYLYQNLQQSVGDLGTSIAYMFHTF